MTTNGADVIGGESPTNDAERIIEATAPYVADLTIEGTSDILFHRWSVEGVAEKAAAAKGSAAKKTDDVESYVWRCDDGSIGIPGTYLVGSLIDPRNGAAKYRQDPRSPRKSALDLFRAGVVPITNVTPILTPDADGNYTGCETWDYLDKRRVMVQRNAVTRMRPAFHTGWRARFEVSCLTPEYIPPTLLLDVMNMAGRLVGVGDFRPTFGRFAIVTWDIRSF